MQLEERKITFMTRRLGGGGAERMTAVLADGFAGRGLDVSILCVDGSDGAYEVNENVKIYSLNPSTSRIIGRVQRLLGINRYMRCYSPDVVIALGGPVSYIQALNRKFKCDLVLSERNWPKSYYSPSQFKQVEHLYETATKVVFQTPEAQACFSDKVRQNSAVIPNAVMTRLPERRLPCSNRIVAVGRLEPQKNYDMLLDAYARFREHVTERYTLEIYGVGSLDSHLMSRAIELGIAEDFVLHGFCKNVHEEIADACLYVTTSDFEGLQNSLMEAMAMGIPCIATDCGGGGAKLIAGDDDRCLLVPCGDVVALVSAIESVTTDDELSRCLSERGSAVRTVYSSKAICDMWVEYIESE